MPISNPKEEIDVRILRLIGIEDIFDLDYETYLTLLKEAMVKGRMTKKTIPTEEIMLLTDEYKRVKSKKDKGRFEVKKKKITAKSFSVGGAKGQISGAATKALPGTAIGASPISKSLENNISTITSAVVSIAETLKQQRKISGDASAYDKRKAEQEKRGLAESKLEKRFEGLKKAAEKIIAPVKSLLDRIIQFFTTVIMGRIVYKLVEWLGDPNNASKVKSIIRFVKDWWPALLGSYILFGTSFGKLIRGLTGTVGRFIFQLGRVAIPGLLRLISRNPVASLAVAGGVGAYYASRQNEQKREGITPGQGTPGSAQLQREQVLQRGFGGMFSGGGLLRAFSGGGFASGFVSGEKGVDKVPAMLSDGEFVMSRGAVAKYGVDTLEAMNAAGGGTNKPKIMGGTTYAAGGGMIGDSVQKLREDINNYLKGRGGGPNFDIGNPRTWFPGGGGGSGFNFPGLPGGGGLPGGFNPESYIPSQYRSDYNKAKEAAGSAYNKGNEVINAVKKKLIDAGYLNEKGQVSGAAKNQATNFLSDLLPNLPGVNQLNKATTEQYLKSIGITKENAKYGDAASQAMITGKSGIESAYNIGQLQLNKMSKESKQLYMNILKERMAAGTLKSGDVINPYGMVKKNDPRYREQGSVRFYVDPKTGKGYLLDTYGFDPGKVDLGGPGSAAQKQYEDQVKSFQDPKKKMKIGPLDIPIGQIAKKLDLKPMMDATEGGGLPQYILALRNKLFGYDPFKEASKLDPKRFKTKAQIDELEELGDLKKLAAKQLTPAQKKLIDEKLRKSEIAEKKKRQEQKMGGGSVKLYDKAQKNTGESYKSRFARPKNVGIKPVNPPPKSTPKVVRASPQAGIRGSGSKPSTSRPPSFSASTKGMRSKQETLGMMR